MKTCIVMDPANTAKSRTRTNTELQLEGWYLRNRNGFWLNDFKYTHTHTLRPRWLTVIFSFSQVFPDHTIYYYFRCVSPSSTYLTWPISRRVLWKEMGPWHTLYLVMALISTAFCSEKVCDAGKHLLRAYHVSDIRYWINIWCTKRPPSGPTTPTLAHFVCSTLEGNTLRAGQHTKM